MTNGTLYGAEESFRTKKVLIAAQYSKAKVNLNTTDHESPDFSQRFPLGKVPAFESADKKITLEEANAIMTLVGKNVSGKDDASKAEILQWLILADTEFLPAVLAWTLPALSVMQCDKQQVEAAKSELSRLLDILNDHLLTRTYLVGERITLADIGLACNLLVAYENVLDSGTREQFGNVLRWLETLINQPEFKTVLGTVKFCNTPAEFDAKKFKEHQQTAGAKKEQKVSWARSPSTTNKLESVSDSVPSPISSPRSDYDGYHHGDEVSVTSTTPSAGAPTGSSKKKKKGKKDKKPQQPAAKPAKEPEEPEFPDEPQPEKKKDPFETMPKTSFNFDEFKRVYSNEDTLEKAIPYLFEKFDAENCSVWYCEYKYPEDLALVFMSCNLIAGMFQRLDKLRKNAFGSMVLFGKDHASTISGIWFWRGHDLAFELSPDWQIDYASYQWKKLDWNDPKTKEIVKEYLAWEGKFDGKAFNQGKIFK